MKAKMHNGVRVDEDGIFYAICPYCLGTGSFCSMCQGFGAAFYLSSHPDAFPADLERDYYEDMSMDCGAATEWYDTTDGID